MLIGETIGMHFSERDPGPVLHFKKKKKNACCKMWFANLEMTNFHLSFTILLSV